ncbi:MAG: J domain-containing protein [Desulfobacterales bacterium]|nr:J domain-containing protein [Desulfobacterales bacterium]
MTQKDYYQVLGVDQNATGKQIKESYRQLAFKYHPDRNKENPAASEEMKTVNEAYAVLSNPTKKSEYDNLRNQFGSSAYTHFRKNYSEQDIFSGSDINHIFEEMAKAFGLRGSNEIFKEFYGRGYRQFDFKKSGGFARGYVFGGRFGAGSQQQASLPQGGNLGKISRILLQKISGIKLPEDGIDVHDHLYLEPQQAINGGPYAYFLRRKSKKLVVKIPPGIRRGQNIRLAGMGQEGKNGGQPGDLLLKVHIRKPLLRSIKDFFSKRKWWQ